MIVCSIFDIGELKKLKAEETARIERTSRSLGGDLSNVVYESIDTRDRYYPALQKAGEWLFPPDFALSLNLLTDLGIPRSVGIPPDIRLNS